EISEDKIPAYITAAKLARDDLKSGQKAALVIRLFYEEERQKTEAKRNASLKQNTVLPDLEKREQTQVHVELAKKSGIGKSSMAYLLAVYRNRPDLFERVFDGEYSINKAYTQMKADEEPEEVPQEEPLAADAKAVIERAIREEHMNPQIDESQPAYAPH